MVTNNQTNNRVIPEQACSSPVRRQYLAIKGDVVCNFCKIWLQFLFYQDTLVTFWDKTSKTMSHVNNGFKGYQYYEFNYIKVTLIGRIEIAEMVSFNEFPWRTWPDMGKRKRPQRRRRRIPNQMRPLSQAMGMRKRRRRTISFSLMRTSSKTRRQELANRLEVFQISWIWTISSR